MVVRGDKTMSREKEINELANDINQHCADLNENYCGGTSCLVCLTHALYNAGYRKQSSEVEQLKRNLEQCENGYRQEMHLLKCKLTNARLEVAREIFEEIERETKNHGITYSLRKIAELKKKYTEERK